VGSKDETRTKVDDKSIP